MTLFIILTIFNYYTRKFQLNRRRSYQFPDILSDSYGRTPVSYTTNTTTTTTHILLKTFQFSNVYF